MRKQAITVVVTLAFTLLSLIASGCASGLSASSDSAAILGSTSGGSVESPGAEGKVDAVISSEMSRKDGIAAKFVSGTFEVNEKTGSTVFNTKTELVNESDQQIMEVVYCVACKDSDGNTIHEFNLTYNAEDTPLAPGETVIDDQGFQRVLDGAAAQLSVEVLGRSTDEEKPPVYLPREGDYLYEVMIKRGMPDLDEVGPTFLRVGIDQMGDLREAEFSGAALGPALDAFRRIRVGTQTDEFVTDNDNYIVLGFPDGQTYRAHINLRNLELSAYGHYHAYALDDAEDLWRLAEERAVEVSLEPHEDA